MVSNTNKLEQAVSRDPLQWIGLFPLDLVWATTWPALTKLDPRPEGTLRHWPSWPEGLFPRTWSAKAWPKKSKNSHFQNEAKCKMAVFLLDVKVVMRHFMSETSKSSGVKTGRRKGEDSSEKTPDFSLKKKAKQWLFPVISGRVGLKWFYRSTQRQFSENICSEDDFRNNCCKISCLPASPRIFEHLKNGIIAHF